MSFFIFGEMEDKTGCILLLSKLINIMRDFYGHN